MCKAPLSGWDLIKNTNLWIMLGIPPSNTYKSLILALESSHAPNLIRLLKNIDWE